MAWPLTIAWTQVGSSNLTQSIGIRFNSIIGIQSIAMIPSNGSINIWGDELPSTGVGPIINTLRYVVNLFDFNPSGRISLIGNLYCYTTIVNKPDFQYYFSAPWYTRNIYCQSGSAGTHKVILSYDVV
jgi:hypothetical protein